MNERIVRDPVYYGYDDQDTNWIKEMGFVQSKHGEVWYHPSHWAEVSPDAFDKDEVRTYHLEVMRPLTNEARTWLEQEGTDGKWMYPEEME